MCSLLAREGGDGGESLLLGLSFPLCSVWVYPVEIDQGTQLGKELLGMLFSIPSSAVLLPPRIWAGYPSR